MIRRSPRALAAVALAVASLMAGCGSPAPRSRASAAAAAACRQRADQVYLQQNRGELYQTDRYVSSGRDTPLSASALSGITSAGLSGQYARDQLRDECLSSSGSGAATPQPAPDPPTVKLPGQP